MLAASGLGIALGLPALAILGSHGEILLSDVAAAVLLSLTPWLVLIWILLVERRTLADIGLRRPGWSSIGFGLAGIAVNLAISLGMGAVGAALGWHEVQSALMTRLLAGPGWFLVLMVGNGALLTEIAFRGYAIERLGTLLGGRFGLAAAAQIGLTTLLFIVSRGPGHGLVWLIDDIVFSVFYLWRRDLGACLIAHAVPNVVASTLVALGVAG